MSELIYPDFIKTGDKIGVTACSDGRVEVLGKYPSPLGPKPDPGVPTTFACSNK